MILSRFLPVFLLLQNATPAFAVDNLPLLAADRAGASSVTTADDQTAPAAQGACRRVVVPTCRAKQVVFVLAAGATAAGLMTTQRADTAGLMKTQSLRFMTTQNTHDAPVLSNFLSARGPTNDSGLSSADGAAARSTGRSSALSAERLPVDLAAAPSSRQWTKIIYNASCASCGDGQTTCFSLAKKNSFVEAVRWATPEIITNMVVANADALRAVELELLVERANFPLVDWYHTRWSSGQVHHPNVPSDMEPCTGSLQKTSQDLVILELLPPGEKLSSLTCRDPSKSPDTAEESKCVSLLLVEQNGVPDKNCVNVHESTVAQLEAQTSDRNACQKLSDDINSDSAFLGGVRDVLGWVAVGGVYTFCGCQIYQCFRRG